MMVLRRTAVLDVVIKLRLDRNINGMPAYSEACNPSQVALFNSSTVLRQHLALPVILGSLSYTFS